MNCACYRFSLSMQSNQSQVSLPVLLNDTGRRLLIKLVDNGKPYYINDGCRAVFYAEKSDGKVLVNDCIIEKNAKIRYDFTAQTASAGGISKCEIRLYGANGRLITSPKFIMVIDSKVIYDDEVLASYSEFTTLDNIIASEQSRVEAEAERVKADAERARELDIRTEAAISAMMSSVPVIDAEKEGKTTTITVTTPEETKTVTVEDGKDGYTPVKGVDYFDGKDGYTPVKGVDYFDGENAEGGDWDAAEGETGHILNRTHYKEETPAVVLYDGSSTFATELGSITGIDTTQIAEGGTYAVTWNGVVYKCVAVLSGSLMLGNLSLMSAGEDTGEPFVIEVLSDTSAYVYKNTSTAETVTIKVEIPGEVTYHKLPKEYLPDDIGNLDEDAVKEIVAEYNAENPFTETDPTVPAWAKEPTKPTYTAAEVGALPNTTVIPTVPTNVSAFTNDVGYAKTADIPSGVMIVTATNGTTDRTAAEAIAHIKNGGSVVMQNGGECLCPSHVYDDYLLFETVVIVGNSVLQTTYQFSGNKYAVLASEDHTHQKLTINGTTYDGSSPVTVEIPDFSQNGNGLSDTARALLITILRNAVYTSDQSAIITAFEKALASSGSGSTDNDDDSGSTDDGGETEATLTGITATYSGGEVAAGTALTDLTGINVMAVYSDGSTETVTDYTLSGEIVAGSNTITVSYGGMTNTFTVTGLVVFGFDDIALGSTVSFTSCLGISTTTGTTNRATLVPVGIYLTKGKTYQFSLGDAASGYYYGVQIFIASEAGLEFKINGGQQTFPDVPTRSLDTGWMQADYEYTATENNEILAVNFKNSANSALSDSDRETLLANVTIEEV